MRQLSSMFTWFYKFVFSTLWIGLFGFATLLLLTDPESFRTGAGTGDPVLEFLFAWLLGATFIYFLAIRLKSVALEGQHLVISNFFKTIRVPLSQVEKVSGSLLIHPELVWIRFKSPTEFGESIQFMAPWRLIQGFSRHPLVQELTDLVQQAKTQGNPGR